MNLTGGQFLHITLPSLLHIIVYVTSQSLNCIVGNVGVEFKRGIKTSAVSVLIICPAVHNKSNIVIGVWCKAVDCFSKPGAYITHNATSPLSD